MSHDQKPGKMRVVGNSSATPQRRRGDPAADATGGAVAAGAGSVPIGAAEAASGAVARAEGMGSAAAEGGKPVLLLGMVFIAGCAIGGMALPLLGVI